MAKILESPDEIQELLGRVKRVAVLGIKTDEKRDQPAYYVPAYAQKAGLEIVPVPVYHANATEILGEKVYRKLSEIPGPIDMVNVFRRPNDIPPHIDEIIAKKPAAVWFQLGIVNDAAAQRLVDAGIDVVQDHCLMVELRRAR